MKSDNFIADLIFGIIFLFLGFNLVFNKKKVIDALIESSKMFWGKMGITTDQTKGALTSVMIPLIGVTFLIVSGILIYKALIYWLK
jgi:ammonia channel protein AmtB